MEKVIILDHFLYKLICSKVIFTQVDNKHVFSVFPIKLSKISKSAGSNSDFIVSGIIFKQCEFFFKYHSHQQNDLKGTRSII